MMDDAREFQFCRCCGAKVNPRAAAQNMQVISASPNGDAGAVEPNLNIQYYSINPGVTMIVRFLFSGQSQYFLSGQRFSFHMPYGMHRITLQIGRRNYARDIFLPDTNAPVTIYASWDGRAHIEITNPPYTPPAQVQQVVYVPVPTPVNNPAPAPEQIPADGKVCPQCGRVNAQNYTYCVLCGTPLDVTDPPEQEEPLKEDAPKEEQIETVCENCGRTLRSDESFCPGCGTKNPDAE